MSQLELQIVSAETCSEVATGLAVVLSECVQANASIGFLLPFEVEHAHRYWRQVFDKVITHKLLLIVAKVDGIVVAAVQLQYAMPDNQQHRADVAKLIVHPQHQRRGIAKALMVKLEQEALLKGRTLLVLDTKTGDSAEPLYLSLGYIIAGVIPRFAQNTAHDGYASTTIMYKNISW